MRAVIYKRVSVLRNHIDGTSLDVQHERLEAYAKAHGWDVVGVYEDAGISGKDTNRPQLQRMLQDAEKGVFEVILVYKLDRLSRSVSDFHQLANFLDSHKIALVSVTQHLDTSSPTGRLLRNILVDFANFERELITERIMDNKLHRATEGKWNGGHAPLGYKLVNKKLELVPEEAAQVREVYDLYLTNKLSMRKIAKMTGIGFSRIELILTNPIYAGKLAYGKTKYKNTKGQFKRKKPEEWIWGDSDHEPIITFEEWQRVQEIKKANTRIPSERTVRQIFRGLCYCGKCGRKLYFFWNGTETHAYAYYRCHDYNRFEGCRSLSISQIELEEKVVRKLNELLSNKMFWKAVKENIKNSGKKKSGAEQEIDVINKALQKIEERIKRLVKQMADTDIAHLIKPQLLEMEQERKTLMADRDAFLSQQTEQTVTSTDLSSQLMKEIMSGWEYLSIEEKSEGIHLLIKKITIFAEYVEIEWTDSSLPNVTFLLNKKTKNGRIKEYCF
ncbi:recombinase family protein [Aneurinibacillus aneurinilyticus]|uniref:recombinase family protein n=1 Tax=Aneurinibacillus aneurinilyticus TaxID=1391 RepID=UPI002E1A7B15|nr:recombinase family protein [Aneurinibacillus aneurinilyticus]